MQNTHDNERLRAFSPFPDPGKMQKALGQSPLENAIVSHPTLARQMLNRVLRYITQNDQTTIFQHRHITNTP